MSKAKKKEPRDQTFLVAVKLVSSGSTASNVRDDVRLALDRFGSIRVKSVRVEVENKR